MGRGRAKAKQTKVARELKYHSPTTDLAALQRELTGRSDSAEEGEDLNAEGRTAEGDHDDENGSWAARPR